jgi:hypothetical protein
MRETQSGNESSDPAMDCIIALEEQRLGRCLNSREIDELVRRFTTENERLLNPSEEREVCLSEQAIRRRRI